MLSPVDNILRAINFIFLVIAISLISALLNTNNSNSTRLNFCLFAAAYGIATDSLFALFANFIPELTYPIILFSLDFLNFVFTFTAGTTLAVGIRAHSCLNRSYLNSNKIAQGSENRCRQAQAAVAFFYFSMAIFIVKMIMSGIKLWRNGLFDVGMPMIGSSRRRRRSTNKTGVPMTHTSQVGVPTSTFSEV